MDAQKYLDGHWGTGGIAHSQMIQFMEEYADIKLAEWKAKNLPQSPVNGSLLLHDLFQVAVIKNEDSMPVIKYVDKPNGGSVAYVRHDAMVNKLNSLNKTQNLGICNLYTMKKAILRVGTQYVTDAPINFGYTTLSKDFKDAKVFDSFEDATNYASLLAMECEVVGV